MSRQKHNLRAFLHNKPNATVEQAWAAAWKGAQKAYHSKTMNAYKDRVATLEAENAKFSGAPHPDNWKKAVDDALVLMQSTADSYPSAKEAIKDLIDWHVAVATDPKVGGKPVIPDGWEVERDSSENPHFDGAILVSNGDGPGVWLYRDGDIEDRVLWAFFDAALTAQPARDEQ